jgi:cell wall-associated NlpC family hydrolase
MADTAGASASAVNGQGIAAKAIDVGAAMAGKTYVWGGKTTDGFDCSGFVSYVLQQLFPNASYGGDVAGYIASAGFDDVAEADRKAGDLIIFTGQGGSPNHIGIVVDATHWIGCQSSTGVAQVLFKNIYWAARPHKYRRLKGISTAAVNSGRRFAAFA